MVKFTGKKRTTVQPYSLHVYTMFTLYTSYGRVSYHEQRNSIIQWDSITVSFELWIPAGQINQVDRNFAKLRMMAKQIRKPRRISSHKSEIFLNFTQLYSWLANSLCRLALGGQTVENLHRLAYEFELYQSHRKSSQVGGQTKRKLNSSRKLAWTCHFSVSKEVSSDWNDGQLYLQS